MSIAHRRHHVLSATMSAPPPFIPPTFDPNGWCMVYTPEAFSVSYNAATGKVVHLMVGCFLKHQSGNMMAAA